MDYKRYKITDDLINLINETPGESGCWCYKDIGDFDSGILEYNEHMLKYTEQYLKEDIRILKVLKVLRYVISLKETPEQIIHRLQRLVGLDTKISEINAKILSEISDVIGDFFLDFSDGLKYSILKVEHRIEERKLDLELYKKVQKMDFDMNISFVKK